ncbi:MAG: hypothetical protein HYY21_09085, partial [Candidatus Tectomicrobia bacterium]|nr:hypothetical protein [Candidatus Tectomicrobia bacterium]
MEEQASEQLEQTIFVFLAYKRMETDTEVYQGAALVTDIRCKPLYRPWIVGHEVEFIFLHAA